MRNVIAIFSLAVPVATLTLSEPASARSYIYSTQYCAREYDGAMDCSYFTLWQCRMAVSATGGDCAVNPRFAGYPAPRDRRRHRPR